MNDNQDIIIKHLSLKLELTSDIRHAEGRIAYVISNNAEKLLTTILKPKIITNGLRPDKIELSREEYERIEHFFFCIQRESMFNMPDQKHLKDYYTEIDTKNKILKKL